MALRFSWGRYLLHNGDDQPACQDDRRHRQHVEVDQMKILQQREQNDSAFHWAAQTHTQQRSFQGILFPLGSLFQDQKENAKQTAGAQNSPNESHTSSPAGLQGHVQFA